jgi:hypothetical protein
MEMAEVKLVQQYLFRFTEQEAETPFELLIDLWSDGNATAAVRSRTGDIWGMPVDGVRT